jgi:hypothetical protein
MGETSGKGEKSGTWEYKNGDILNSFYRLPIVWQKKTRISPFLLRAQPRLVVQGMFAGVVDKRPSFQ